MKKRILIVSYSMPPSSDIGGRRWVKFAKYLKRNGHFVRIIAAQESPTEPSPWLNDGNELKDEITFINSFYPKFLGINPKTFIEKILYRVSKAFAITFNKGNYYDKSNYWETNLLKICRIKIKDDEINNLICSIPPFRSAYFLLKLKEEFPKLNLIVDYRDPWTENKTSFGFEALSKKRFAYEKKLENAVVNGYDRIITVSNEMKDNFKEFLNWNSEQKITVIPNGFDSEDFLNVKVDSSDKEKTQQIKVVFTGTFYDKSIHVFERLVVAVLMAETKYPEKRGFVKFEFIGSIPAMMKITMDKLPHCFSFGGKKGISQTYDTIASSNFCSLFLSDDLNYSMSTKFYEYIALKKPILSFSKVKGANAKFIEDNNLGFGIDYNTMNEMIERLYNNSLSNDYIPKIDISKFDTKNLVAQIEKIII